MLRANGGGRNTHHKPTSINFSASCLYFPILWYAMKVMNETERMGKMNGKVLTNSWWSINWCPHICFLKNSSHSFFMPIAHVERMLTITSHVVLIITLEFNANPILPLLATGSKYDMLNWWKCSFKYSWHFNFASTLPTPHFRVAVTTIVVLAKYIGF